MSSRQLIIVKYLVSLIFALLPLCNAVAQYSFGLDHANTTAGELLISIDPPHKVSVTLAGKVLLTDDNEHYSWHVVSAFPITGQSRLVLLSSDSGNNWCPASHRVLEIKPDGKQILTSEFGKCALHDALRTSTRAEKIALNNPKFVHGEWHIGLDLDDEKTNRSSRVWYIYKDGLVRLNGKTVAKAQ
jgi:hypothetical protein